MGLSEILTVVGIVTASALALGMTGAIAANERSHSLLDRRRPPGPGPDR